MGERISTGLDRGPPSDDAATASATHSFDGDADMYDKPPPRPGPIAIVTPTGVGTRVPRACARVRAIGEVGVRELDASPIPADDHAA
jgi:hypothetical protein